ncbi:MAG: hypothetical protein LC772_07125 [Chloroflexi bacterium]|nr:hypothetical protein [Chloroflexota bacterium]
MSRKVEYETVCAARRSSTYNSIMNTPTRTRKRPTTPVDVSAVDTRAAKAPPGVQRASVEDAAIARDVRAVNRLEPVHTALKVLSEATGMRIALVARITSDSWTACAVLDNAGFGIKSGDQVELATTY